MTGIQLKFTSEAALKRSIRQKYPGLNKDQWKATFIELKKYVGSKTEDILDEKYAQYKKDNNIA